MPARDDYPNLADPGLGCWDDERHAAVAEIDTLRAQTAVMEVMMAAAAVGQAALEAGLTPQSVKAIVRYIDNWDEMAIRYLASNGIDAPLNRTVQEQLERFGAALADLETAMLDTPLDLDEG